LEKNDSVRTRLTHSHEVSLKLFESLRDYRSFETTLDSISLSEPLPL
jgi:dGTP triphosphohydrolase